MARGRELDIGKRIMDVGIIAATLWLWLPLMLLLALIVVSSFGRPVLFRQVRPGLHGRPFTLLKFRTMSEERDSLGNLLPDSARLTRVGRFLRATSLDELPEVVNVLRGEMSLVGPRPLLMEYLPLYNEEQRLRHSVLPGITGWAQINGRNAISWQDRFALDAWYVRNRTLGLDIRILARTVLQVLRRHGITAEGEATVGRFRGNS